jgi:hypothetical protein
MVKVFPKLRIGDAEYTTVTEAADRLTVKPKTVYDWIDKHWVPQPPTVMQGTKEIYHFPEAWFRTARAMIAARAKKKKATKKKR